MRTDSERLDEVERRGLTVEHRGGISKAVDPWMVRVPTDLHKALTYWTGRTVREAIDAATDAQATQSTPESQNKQGSTPLEEQ